MDVNPQQYEPQTREPGERQTQVGQASQADVPLSQTPHNAPISSHGQTVGANDIMPGTDVYGSDDKKVGTVQQAFEESFLVRKGMFFVHDFYIPYAYVARADADRIDLNMTGDEARDQDWTQRPGTGVEGSVPPRQATSEFGVYGPSGSQDTIQAATEGNNTLIADMASQPSAGGLGGPAMPVAGLTPMVGMGVPPSPAPGTSSGMTPGVEPTTGGEILTGQRIPDEPASTASGARVDRDIMRGPGTTSNTDVMAGTELPRRTDIVSDDPYQTGGTTTDQP
jgi:hypothetical protein